MDIDLITTVATAAGGSVTGALTTGWIAKLLIKRFLKDNDSKHDLTARTMSTISDKLSEMDKKLAVIEASLGSIMILKEQVQADHDNIVRLSTWNEKYSNDLKAQFSVIRSLKKDFEDVGKLISELRRGASNG